MDKTVYQQAYRDYQRWNELTYAERVRNPNQLSAEQVWAQYVNLVQLLWKLCPEQSLNQQTQKLRAWERYYARMQLFEERRGNYGKTT